MNTFKEILQNDKVLLTQEQMSNIENNLKELPIHLIKKASQQLAEYLNLIYDAQHNNQNLKEFNDFFIKLFKTRFMFLNNFFFK